MPRVARGSRYVSRRRVGVRKSKLYKARKSIFSKMSIKGFLRMNRGFGKTEGNASSSACNLQASTTAGLYILVQPNGSQFMYTGPSVPEAGVTNLYTIPCACVVHLNNLINFGEMTNLFDKYRIRAVVLKFILTQTESSNSDSLPYVSYVKDEDSNTPIVDIQEYSGVRYKHFKNGILTIKYIPKILGLVGTVSGAQAESVMSSKKWLDCVDDDVAYFGMKFNFHNVRLNGTNNRWKIDIIPRVILELKNVI